MYADVMASKLIPLDEDKTVSGRVSTCALQLHRAQGY